MNATYSKEELKALHPVLMCVLSVLRMVIDRVECLLEHAGFSAATPALVW